MTTASDKIATFITSFQHTTLTPSHLHLAARALFDTLVCALAGAREPAADIVLKYARGQTALATGTVWATGEQLPIELAALVNGTMGHALDYDDVSSPLRGHPSVASFSTASRLVREVVSHETRCRREGIIVMTLFFILVLKSNIAKICSSSVGA
jgi:2-methylcitrate dehydratase PrpD